MEHQDRPAILLSTWGVGTWIDRWMFVHILSGVVIGLLLRLLGMEVNTAFWLTLSLLLLWELFERVLRLYEPFVNIVLDIVVGSLGFWLAFHYIPRWGGSIDWLVFIAFSLVTMTLSYAGWTDSRRRAQYHEISKTHH